MTTNGESARKWLMENKKQVTEQRIIQIRDNLIKKINLLTETSEDISDAHQGLLEALDVMDDWLQQTAQGEPAEPSALDCGALVEEPSVPVPLLSPEEKRQRFRKLLESSRG